MLFQGTLADNLRIAKPDASEAEMRAAIEAAHLTAFVDGLSQGLDTPVGERGAVIVRRTAAALRHCPRTAEGTRPS